MRLNGLMILMTGWFWGTMTSETAMTSVNRSHCPGPHAGCLWAGRPGSKTPTSCHLPGTEGRSPKFLLTPWRIRMDGMFRAAWWSVSWWLGQRIQREGKVDRKTRLVKKKTRLYNITVPLNLRLPPALSHLGPKVWNTIEKTTCTVTGYGDSHHVGQHSMGFCKCLDFKHQPSSGALLTYKLAHKAH